MNAERLKHGIAGGLAGGVVFGIMMGMMGMLPMIGEMVGLSGAAGGFLVHMVISALIGAGFGLVLGPRVHGSGSAVLWGLLYGGVWWLLGPLTLMPLFMGMGLGVNWNGEVVAGQIPSLMGHLVYGFLLGLTYGWLERRSAGVEAHQAQWAHHN